MARCIFLINSPNFYWILQLTEIVNVRNPSHPLLLHRPLNSATKYQTLELIKMKIRRLQREG